MYATILSLKRYSNELHSIQNFRDIFASNFASISIAELSSWRHITVYAASTEVRGINRFIQFGESARCLLWHIGRRSQHFDDWLARLAHLKLQKDKDGY